MNKNPGLNHTLSEPTHGTSQNSTNLMNTNGRLRPKLLLKPIAKKAIMMKIPQSRPTIKEIDTPGTVLIQEQPIDWYLTAYLLFKKNSN